MALGNPDAPVTVVEYASMTCPHCRAFHTTVFHDFVERYVDTGQVRFIFREFPLEPYAKAGAMLARCTDPSAFFTMVDLLFETQATWAGNTDAMFTVAQQAGFTRESFEACLANQEIEAGIDWSQNRGTELGVNGTPYFFINGQRHSGEISLEDLGRLVQAEL
jgi:protein-disulfide isomerase